MSYPQHMKEAKKLGVPFLSETAYKEWCEWIDNNPNASDDEQQKKYDSLIK